MMLIERTAVPAAALPLARFKEHLRLGTGFSDDGTEDVLLEALLRAAMAAIEGRTGKALISREFTWVLGDWRGLDGQVLPVAPVAAVMEVRIVDRAEGVAVVAPTAYRIEPDTHRPSLAGNGTLLPTIPTGGRVEIDFEAGFGAAWEAVPPDLAQAVFLLAAHYHENRQETVLGQGAMPFGVSALIERWRPLRLTAGGSL